MKPDNSPVETEPIAPYDLNLLPEQKPPLAKRIQALLMDNVLVFLILGFIIYLLENFVPEAAEFRGMLFIGGLILYEPVLVSLMGSTLGHESMNLKVKRASNLDKNPNFFQAAARYLIKAMLGVISLLTVTGEKNKRALHDLMTGTVVVAGKPKPFRTGKKVES